MTLEHPIDEAGKWTRLVEGCILRVPVPRGMTPYVKLADQTITHDTSTRGVWRTVNRTSIRIISGNGKIDGLMRGDYKSRMEGYAIARQNGWMSANDIRALENQNPIPADQGGDAYLVNGNMISILTATQSRPSGGSTLPTEDE